jgi:hypothetical protein
MYTGYVFKSGDPRIALQFVADLFMCKSVRCTDKSPLQGACRSSLQIKLLFAPINIKRITLDM